MSCAPQPSRTSDPGRSDHRGQTQEASACERLLASQVSSLQGVPETARCEGNIAPPTSDFAQSL